MDDCARPRLLVVDDDKEFVEAATTFAEASNFSARGAGTVALARDALRDDKFDLVLLDLALPDGSGFELVEEFGNRSSIAVVTGSASVDEAARAVGMPISGYLRKPLARQQFSSLLNSVVASRSSLAPSVGRNFQEFVGESLAMQKVYREIQRVGPTPANVLLVGESGTGKELAARALHQVSGRTGELIGVNCGAVAPELLASHLFGHERGSFTGAIRQHRGHFEQAHGGTLLLDEITEMPLALQVHLLRVLETRRITRLGGMNEHEVDVRVIAACNRRPADAVREGRLREDLYFRLAEFSIALPPLRERGEDAVLIAEALLRDLNERYGTSKYFSHQSQANLRFATWQGNVRELRNVVYRAYIMCDDDVVVIPEGEAFDMHRIDQENILRFPLGTRLDVVEREMLIKTLEFFNGDKVSTAKALGITVKTVYNHLARYASERRGN
jgi:DNA-binding NtrC family response regulator